MTKPKSPPGSKFEDFNSLSVNLTEVRANIAVVQKMGIDTMPLGEFLRLIKKSITKVERPD